MRQARRAPEVDGALRGFGLTDIMGGGYTQTLEELLDERVYPAWPDVVERYRTREIELDTMWGHIVRETDQMITAVAHAEAEAFTSESGQMLAQPGLVGKPGAELYLGPAWRTIFKAVDGTAVLPNFAEFAEADRRISDAGERGLLNMWKTLGITATESVDRSFALRVVDPQR